jgi:hypothetical protein
MDTFSNPVVTGTLSLVAGNLLASSVGRFSQVIETHFDVAKTISLSGSSRTILDNSISILFQAGLIGVGSTFIERAFPWLTTESASFALFVLGISMSSQHLQNCLIELNKALWVPVQSALQAEDSKPSAPERT